MRAFKSSAAVSLDGSLAAVKRGLLMSLEPLSLRGVCPLTAQAADGVQARHTRILVNFTVKEAQQVQQQVRFTTSFTGLWRKTRLKPQECAELMHENIESTNKSNTR